MSEPVAAAEAASNPERRYLVRLVQRSDVGRVRTENQDYATATTPEEAGEKGHLLIVADGMGGHRGGATASRIAGTIVKSEFLESNDADDVPEVLRRALENANAQIFAESQSNPELRGMGTTCSALVIRGENAWFAHVGDSRIYLVRDETIRPLTEDHSLVASMVKEGLLTPEEAEVHPRRNVLQRSMGVTGEVQVDVSEPLTIEPGDRFILCSDGLYGLVKDEELRSIALHHDLGDAAEEFVQRALERGAPDNVTVIVAGVEEMDGSPDSAGADDDTLIEGSPRSAERRKRQSGGLLKWLLIGLLVFGATGAALLYWNEGWLLTLFQRLGR